LATFPWGLALSDPGQLVNARRARILAADIGATHSRLAIYTHEDSRFDLLRRETYSSLQQTGLTDMLTSFLESEQDEVDAGCLGLPAPIHPGILSPPNLPWQIDREQVFRTVGTERVALINDVEASAAGIEGLSEHDLVCLQPGQVDPAGNRAVISLGTGLGVSVLTPSGDTFATEAGHATFTPSRERDFELQDKLQSEYGHVSWERVVSGAALPKIHTLLSPGAPELEPAEIVRRSASDPACSETVNSLRRYIGAAAGSFALTLMATGGLYLTGGVAVGVLGRDNANPFLESLQDKGRMRPLLARIPVFVVHERNLALRGAARMAVTRFATF
jgi:glucokinase